MVVVVLANKFNWDEKVGMNLLLRVSSDYLAGLKPAGSTTERTQNEPKLPE